MCKVTYGVIVRCQWAFARTTLTWKHSMEHSKPLMASNGEWHQSCHVSCYFSFFLFHFGLSLFSSLWGEVYGHTCGHKRSPQPLLASALIDLVGWRGCDGQSDFVQYLPSVGLPLWVEKEWKLTEYCVSEGGRRQRMSWCIQLFI